jgi:hypothetical protein
MKKEDMKWSNNNNKKIPIMTIYDLEYTTTEVMSFAQLMVDLQHTVNKQGAVFAQRRHILYKVKVFGEPGRQDESKKANEDRKRSGVHAYSTKSKQELCAFAVYEKGRKEVL